MQIYKIKTTSAKNLIGIHFKLGQIVEANDG